MRTDQYAQIIPVQRVNELLQSTWTHEGAGSSPIVRFDTAMVRAQESRVTEVRARRDCQARYRYKRDWNTVCT